MNTKFIMTISILIVGLYFGKKYRERKLALDKQAKIQETINNSTLLQAVKKGCDSSLEWKRVDFEIEEINCDNFIVEKIRFVLGGGIPGRIMNGEYYYFREYWDKKHYYSYNLYSKEREKFEEELLTPYFPEFIEPYFAKAIKKLLD